MAEGRGQRRGPGVPLPLRAEGPSPSGLCFPRVRHMILGAGPETEPCGIRSRERAGRVPPGRWRAGCGSKAGSSPPALEKLTGTTAKTDPHLLGFSGQGPEGLGGGRGQRRPADVTSGALWRPSVAAHQDWTWRTGLQCTWPARGCLPIKLFPWEAWSQEASWIGPYMACEGPTDSGSGPRAA